MCLVLATDHQSSHHDVLLRPSEANAHPDAASISSDPRADLPRRRTRLLDGLLHHLSSHPLEDASSVSISLEWSTSLFEHFRRHYQDAASRGSQRTVPRSAVDAPQGIHGAGIVVDDQREVSVSILDLLISLTSFVDWSWRSFSYTVRSCDEENFDRNCSWLASGLL